MFFRKYAGFMLALDIALTVFFALCTITSVQAHHTHAAVLDALVTIIWIFNIVLDVHFLKERDRNA